MRCVAKIVVTLAPAESFDSLIDRPIPSLDRSVSTESSARFACRTMNIAS